MGVQISSVHFLCIYFKTKWMNRSIKVLSITAYYFFSSLRQFLNSISKKWIVFGGNSILEPIFDFCEKNEPVTYQIVLHPSEPVIRRSNKEEYGMCGKTSYLSVSKYFFTTLATWGWTLLWRRITLSCLCVFRPFFSQCTAQTNQL